MIATLIHVSGRAREISWLTYLLAIVLVVRFVFVEAE